MRNRWTVCLTLITLLTGILPAAGPTLAAGPILPAGLAQGDDFLISHAEGTIRGSPAVAYNDDQGEYLVVWADGRGNGAYWDIYGQFVTAGGLPKGDNFVIRDEATNILTYPDVAYDTTNQRYLVVWYDLSEVDVEGQILNSDGSAFGSALNIAEGDPGDMRGYPAVAFHPQLGEYLVVYHGGAAGNLNIYGKRVGAAGSVGATEYGVSTAAGDQTDPDVSVDPSTGGDFLIVWEDGRVATDQIYGCLMYSTWFLGAEFVISTHATEARTDPAVAFSPDADEWLVVFERDVAGDSQIVGQRVTSAGAATGNNFGICGDAEDQTDPALAYDTHSNQFLVAWRDYRNGATTDIYGRRVDASGSTVGSTFAVSAAPGTQVDPAVAASPASPGYLVAFTDFATVDISGQQISTDGALLGPRLTVSTPVDDQEQPAMAYNSQDTEFLVVWQDQRAGNWDIWGQRLDLDGTPLDGSFVICSNAGDQLYPDVAYNLDTNQYLVVWEDRRTDADIYGQRVNANGTLDGGEIIIASSGSTLRQRPRVAFNPISGEYLVVYACEVNAGDHDIRARRVPAAGNPSTGEITDIATGTTDQNYPDVACRTMEPGGGGYLVVWRDTDGAQRDIRGQRLNQNGGLLGSLDLCTEASNQWSPAVAYSPDDDRYLVVWPDDRDSASQGRNLYGRQVGGGGALYDEFAISTASGDQAPVAVTYGRGPASYIVAWEDTRNAGTTPDLYGQRVSGVGELVDTDAGNNDLLYTGPGGQESPAVAWADDGTQGLLAWEDDRNRASYDIYGLRLEAVPVTAGNRIFLPLVVRND